MKMSHCFPFCHRKRLNRCASGKSLDRQSIASMDSLDLTPPRRICSRHSGRDLQLDDNECEQLSAAFAVLPDKYGLFEVGIMASESNNQNHWVNPKKNGPIVHTLV
jgi:hypothetical protein